MSEQKKWKFTDMARRFARGHLPAQSWTDRDVKALADLLGSVRMRSYGEGFNKGYAAGHEDQMKMRIADELERNNAASVRP